MSQITCKSGSNLQNDWLWRDFSRPYRACYVTLMHNQDWSLEGITVYLWYLRRCYTLVHIDPCMWCSYQGGKAPTSQGVITCRSSWRGSLFQNFDLGVRKNPTEFAQNWLTPESLTSFKASLRLASHNLRLACVAVALHCLCSAPCSLHWCILMRVQCTYMPHKSTKWEIDCYMIVSLILSGGLHGPMPTIVVYSRGMSGSPFPCFVWHHCFP